MHEDQDLEMFIKALQNKESQYAFGVFRKSKNGSIHSYINTIEYRKGENTIPLSLLVQEIICIYFTNEIKINLDDSIENIKEKLFDMYFEENTNKKVYTFQKNAGIILR